MRLIQLLPVIFLLVASGQSLLAKDKTPVKTVYYSTSGEKLFDCPRDLGLEFRNGRAVVYDKDFGTDHRHNYCIINTSGEVISANYDYLEDNRGGTFTYTSTIRFMGEESTMKGLLDRDGKEITLPRFNSIGYFYDGLSQTRVGELWGSINPRGKWIIPPRFKHVGQHVDGKVLAITEEYLVLFNSEGEKLDSVKMSLDKAPRFLENGWTYFKQNGKYGLLDENLEVAIPAAYESFRTFPTCVLVKKDGQWGMLDLEGNVVMEFEYDGARSDGSYAFLMKMSSDGSELWKAIHTQSGKETPFKYTDIDGFSDGYCGVSIRTESGEEKWSFLNEDLEEVAPFEFDLVGFFERGVSFVSADGDTYFVDKKLTPLFNKQFDYCAVFPENDLLGVRNTYEEGWKWGVMAKEGTLLVPMQFKDAPRMSDTDPIFSGEIEVAAEDVKLSETVEPISKPQKELVNFDPVIAKLDEFMLEKQLKQAIKRTSKVGGKSISSQYFQTWSGNTYYVVVLVPYENRNDIGLVLKDNFIGTRAIEPGSYEKFTDDVAALNILKFEVETSNSTEFKITNESDDLVRYAFVIYQE